MACVELIGNINKTMRLRSKYQEKGKQLSYCVYWSASCGRGLYGILRHTLSTDEGLGQRVDDRAVFPYPIGLGQAEDSVRIGT
jgi:hypothetical protein